MTKKILALVLALVMVFAMTACTSTEEPAESPAATDDAGTESTEPTASAGSGEVVNLLYYEIGNQDTNSREAVQEAINAYIEPLIGANVEFRIVSWADWDSRALTALQSGEEIDLFFTADWKQYTRSVMQGLFTALNDDNGAYGNLLETYGQDITNSLNPLFITGTQIDGINYAVPVNKELAVPNGYIVNLDAAEEVGMDPTTITGIADLEPYLAAYKELHPEQYPYVTDRRWCEDPWSESFVAGLNFNLLSTYLSPNEDGTWDNTVYSTWESEEYAYYAQTMYEYAQAGYVHPDTSLAQYDALTQFNAGEFLVYTAPLKGNNIKAQEMKNASGNPDLNLSEIYTQPKIVTTNHTGGSMLAIPVTSENPVKAMQYINLMHTDTELLDMMLYGVQGVQWEFAEDGRVELLDPSWYGVHGGAWTMGNTAIQDVTTDEDPEKNQKLQDYSADAIPHVSLGFRYIIPAELENQLAAVVNVQDAMNRSLLTGAVDPATTLDQYVADLKAAGLDDLKADIERQYAEWKAATGATTETPAESTAAAEATAAPEESAAA